MYTIKKHGFVFNMNSYYCIRQRLKLIITIGGYVFHVHISSNKPDNGLGLGLRLDHTCNNAKLIFRCHFIVFIAVS